MMIFGVLQFFVSCWSLHLLSTFIYVLVVLLLHLLQLLQSLKKNIRKKTPPLSISFSTFTVITLFYASLHTLIIYYYFFFTLLLSNNSRLFFIFFSFSWTGFYCFISWGRVCVYLTENLTGLQQVYNM